MKGKGSSILACVLAVSLVFLSGCSQQPQDEGPQYMDEAFIEDLGEGLEKRWELSDKDAAEDPTGYSTSEQMTSYVQAEIDAVGDYANADFEDPELRELAVSYINVLNDSLEAAKSYSINNTDSLMEWEEIYQERTMLLKDLVANYDVEVSEEHESTLNELVAAGNAAQKTADVKSALEGLASSIQFDFGDDGYGLVTGTTTVANSTGMNFETVQFDVQLYDEAGVRIETTYATVDNWADGEAVNLEIYVTSGVMPASVKVVPSYYSLA